MTRACPLPQSSGGLLERRRRAAAIIVGRGGDPVPLRPFVEKLEARIRTVERHQKTMPFADFADRNALGEVYQEWGITGDSSMRLIYRWRNWGTGKDRIGSDLVAEDRIEDLLHGAGLQLWDLADPEPDDEVCRVGGGETICPLRRGYLEHTRAYFDTSVTRAQRRAGLGLPALVEEEHDDVEGVCFGCGEDVVFTDGQCPWCGAPQVRPVVVAQIQPRKPTAVKKAPATGTRQRKRVKPIAAVPPPDLDAALQPVDGRQRKHGLTEAFVREALRVHLDCGCSLSDAARELYVEGRWVNADSLRSSLSQAFVKRGVIDKAVDRRAFNHDGKAIAAERARGEAYLATPFRDPGYAYGGTALEPDVLWEAAWLYYYEQIGFLRIVRRLRHRLGARRSDQSLCGLLHTTFEINGWPRRDRIEATRAASYRHGMNGREQKNDRNVQLYNKRQQKGTRPKCAGTNKAGHRCQNWSKTGSRFCAIHDEKTVGELRAKQTAARRANMLPSGPLVDWLRAREAVYGTRVETARMLGINESVLGRLLNYGTCSPAQQDRVVSVRFVRRVLDACMTNDPDALVPRVQDLYESEVRA